MDPDLGRWVLEFLLRQPLDDRTLNSVTRVLPLSDINPSLKKRMILRRIESDISNGAVSEKILEYLEQIEELDCIDGIETPEALKVAYFHVAVHCTVRFLDGNDGVDGDNEAKYFDAVKRIWRARVCQMERGEVAGLVSEELVSWRDEIEAAVWDACVRENVLLRFKEGFVDGLKAVRVYVSEMKERLGPSFLELLAETVDNDGVREVLGLGSNGTCGRVGDSLPSSAVVARNDSREMHKGNLRPRRKHVASKHVKGGASRGGKIADTEDPEAKKYDFLPTPEVNKMQEALASSALELQAVVTDPLPDALHLAEDIIENIDHEPTVRNSRVDVDVPSSSVNRSGDTVQGNEGNLGNESCRHQSNVSNPSLMERNSTARTYEWDDSVNSLPEGSPDDQTRLHLATPRTNVGSPLRPYHIKPSRRKVKKWSILEEDTLRTGVKRFGRGNWKAILSEYRDIFEERTEVDLKDKWRNLVRFYEPSKRKL